VRDESGAVAGALLPIPSGGWLVDVRLPMSLPTQEACMQYIRVVRDTVLRTYLELPFDRDEPADFAAAKAARAGVKQGLADIRKEHDGRQEDS